MKAGIVLEHWKLPVFMKHLDDYEYEVFFPPGGGDKSDELITITVETTDPNKLHEVIEAAMSECQRRRSELRKK